MTSRGKSIFRGSFIVAGALVCFACIAVRSLAQAQNAAAQAQAAQARDAEAAAAKARDQAIQAAAVAAQAARVLPAAAAKSGEAASLDLSKYVGMRAENFAKSTRHPWPAVPTGKQTFVGVPVEIYGATMLWGQRNADAGMKYPESIGGIPCGQKFETLYLLHGTFYEGAPGEPSFEVVLNYQGGEKQTEAILCGADTRDWFAKAGEKMAGPSAKRSTLAWTGTGKFGERDQAVRFCMTAIENKYPDRLVTTIDLVSAKKQTAGCILAITVGKAGLLKPPADKPADPSQSKDNKAVGP